MARFTDENKWNDVWFRSLDPKSKLVWNYLCDNCDIAGFYEIDIECISFFTGLKSDEVKGAIKALSRGYEAPNETLNLIFLRNFIKVQKNYPLNPKNSCHKGIIRRILEKGEGFKIARGYIAPMKPLSRGTGKGNSNTLSLNNTQEGDVKGDDEKNYLVKSAKAFVECVQIYPLKVRQNQMAYCRNAWNEAVKRADGFESIVMAVDLYVDFVATTNYQFKKSFQNWLDDNEFNTDWRARKLEAANIPVRHIHQDFIDLWVLECEPTKAQIEAGKNLLQTKNHLTSDDLISVFRKLLKNDRNVKLTSVVAKAEQLHAETQKNKETQPEAIKNGEKHEITLEEIRIMSKMLGKDIMKKDHPELLERLKEAENTT